MPVDEPGGMTHRFSYWKATGIRISPGKTDIVAQSVVRIPTRVCSPSYFVGHQA